MRLKAYAVRLLCLVFFPIYAYATPLIAIDVGHSKLHPGSTSARGKPEFDFNLALAETLRDTLNSQGVSAVLIGNDGQMTELPKRTAAADALGATFLISIHHDSAQPRYFESWIWQGVERKYADRFSGYSLFVSRKNPFLEKSLSCAKAIGSSLKQSGRNPTPHHAENIPGENREWADQQSGTYYYDDLIVLKSARTPAVLLEAGVIVNRNEEQLLQESSTRHAISNAIVQGLKDCGVTQ